jgi:type IV pilus assembly protein PilE
VLCALGGKTGSRPFSSDSRFFIYASIAGGRLYLYKAVKWKVADFQAQMKKAQAFTMVELLAVIFIVGILTAVAMPLIRGKINSSKWSEAQTGAGTIRTAMRTCIAEKGPNYDYSGIEGSLGTQSIYVSLGFKGGDLNGRYFNQGDYSVSNVSADPPGCVIMVTSSVGGGPPGTGTLAADGTWSVAE